MLQTRCALPIGGHDLYVSTVGGMRLTDPSSDLAVALAIASAYLDIALPMNAVVIGEVGLVGDLRRVTGMDRRLAEAARLGFTTALVPPGVTSVPAGLRVITVDHIGAALRALREIAIASNQSHIGQ